MSFFKRIERKLIDTAYVIRNEKIFKAECDIKYLLEKNGSSNKLIIVFSGFPAEEKPASYNYLKVLSTNNYNKLYILDDFGPDIRGGSYYLAENKDFKIERGLVELISNVVDELNIKEKNIITVGSSKGGYAAIYYAIKYHYGNAIVAEPQVMLGNFLNKPKHKKYLNYIMGNDNDESIKYLNCLLFEELKKMKKSTKIHLYCGKNSSHHINHVMPLIKYFSKNDVLYNLELGNHTEHNKIGLFFPDFLNRTMKNL